MKKTTKSATRQFKITSKLVNEIHKLLDKGLTDGLGDPIPGEMCVEAAICHALGEKHSDDPSCVLPTISQDKISLNDSHWSSPKARANGLRDIAIAQLGSRNTVDALKYNEAYQKHLKLIVFPYLFKFAYKTLKEHNIGWLELINDNLNNQKHVINIATELGESIPESLTDSEIGEVPIDEYFNAYFNGGYDTYQYIHEGYFGDKFLRKIADAILAALTEVKSPGVKWVGLNKK